jgi:hypothetical protein
LLAIILKIGGNEEGSFHYNHHIHPSGASFGEASASGKMVSREMVLAQLNVALQPH